MLGRKNKGFTLVEILIVVIILGILAAIVIPQFTSASQDARRSSMSSTVQSLRSQIELYKLQHNDRVPNLTGGAATSWDPLMTVTLPDGTASTLGTPGAVGPYMQAIPTNPFLSGAAASTVTACTGTPAADGTSGFYQDLSTGKIWGVAPDPADSTGKTYVPVGD